MFSTQACMKSNICISCFIYMDDFSCQMKWNNTDVIFPKYRSVVVFIFVSVSITSLYNDGLKNGNFVLKIYQCFTVKISKAIW
jgi:hypothetical protein